MNRHPEWNRANGGLERRLQSFLMAGLLLLMAGVGAKVIYVGEAIATLQAQSIATTETITEMKAAALAATAATTAAALAANTAATAATTAAALAATAATTAAALAALAAQSKLPARRD